MVLLNWKDIYTVGEANADHAESPQDRLITLGSSRRPITAVRHEATFLAAAQRAASRSADSENINLRIREDMIVVEASLSRG